MDNNLTQWAEQAVADMLDKLIRNTAKEHQRRAAELVMSLRKPGAEAPGKDST